MSTYKFDLSAANPLPFEIVVYMEANPAYKEAVINLCLKLRTAKYRDAVFNFIDDPLATTQGWNVFDMAKYLIDTGELEYDSRRGTVHRCRKENADPVLEVKG